MKIWFDADNGPHVLIMRPLAEELRRRGHEIHFTARDRTNTCELLDLYGLEYDSVGGVYGRGMAGKISGTLGRALALAFAMWRRRADVSFGHGSRALPLASRLLGVPSVTMYDYEWVDPTLFNWFCRRILLPDAVDPGRCREAGLDLKRVRFFAGLKEDLYLQDLPEGGGVARELGLREDGVAVLLRPPATTAHYHNPESDRLLAEVLRVLGRHDEVQLVYLPRTPDQRSLVPAGFKGEVIVPDRVYDGPSLVAAMDLVLSGGGTMTREAAVLGVPSYSFFRGREGRVDDALEEDGRLVMLRGVDEVEVKLQVRKRPPESRPRSNPGLVGGICDLIEAAVG